VELMDERAQLVRAHAHEYPFDLAGKCLNHVRDHLQVAAVADTAGPADARPASLATIATQVRPPLCGQAVLRYPDVRMHALHRFSQRLGGHHEAVHTLERSPHVLDYVLRQLVAVNAL